MGVSDFMLENAGEASEFLKPLTHPLRLVILCRLLEGEANVGELEHVSGAPQAVVSKQLANLRAAGLVDFRRDGREIYYTLSHARTRRILLVLYEEFCEECR
ncbi:hypothetical protein LL06_09910 [Hoeflea sp. BAL378]|nr:hypothetical protein LL06_09910 [Hoeflea sp. BAL378]